MDGKEVKEKFKGKAREYKNGRHDEQKMADAIVHRRPADKHIQQQDDKPGQCQAGREQIACPLIGTVME